MTAPTTRCLQRAPGTAQRVYAYHRDYVALHGYAPTSGEACHWMHMSSRHYYAALRWLAERRFLTRQPRRWRGVRINVRVCTCGAEITPENAVQRVERGRVYVRGKCATCWSRQHVASQQAYRARNVGYYTRLDQRRQHRSASA